MLTFTAMAWGGDAIDGVSLIDLRQKLKDITAQQALLLDQVLEHMDDEILNAQLKAMMDEKQALQEQIAAAEQMSSMETSAQYGIPTMLPKMNCRRVSPFPLTSPIPSAASSIPHVKTGQMA